MPRFSDAWAALRGRKPVLPLALRARIDMEVRDRFAKSHGGAVDTTINALQDAGYFTVEPGFWAGVLPTDLRDGERVVDARTLVHAKPGLEVLDVNGWQALDNATICRGGAYQLEYAEYQGRKGRRFLHARAPVRVRSRREPPR